MIFLKVWYIFYVLPGSIPDQGFMKLIQILLNDEDLGGSGSSGSTNLERTIFQPHFLPLGFNWNIMVV